MCLICSNANQTRQEAITVDLIQYLSTMSNSKVRPGVFGLYFNYFLKSIDIVCITPTGRFTLSVCRMRLIFVARLQPSEAASTAYMYAVMRCLSVRLSCCLSRLCIILQELSYRQQIARQLRTQYAEGIYRHKYYTVTLKSRLRVTQGHWKRNHWIDHTRLSSSRVI